MVPDLVPSGAIAITKSNSTTYNPPLVGFIANGAGDVAITDSRGNVTTIATVVVGQPYHVLISKIMSTNTTATLIIGLQQ